MSILSTLDIRTRIIVLLTLNLTCATSNKMVLLINSILFSALIVNSKIPVLKWVGRLKFFSAFLLVICLTRSISTPGSELYSVLGISISREGIESGLLICWQLILVVMLGILFIQGNRTFELKSAIQWFLAPVPYVNGKQIAILLSLMVRFLPLIIHEAEEIKQAQYSRSIGQRLNPIYRMVCFIKPLLRRIFGSVNELSNSMESRSYCIERTELPLVFTCREGIVLIIVFGYGLGVIVLS